MWEERLSDLSLVTPMALYLCEELPPYQKFVHRVPIFLPFSCVFPSHNLVASRTINREAPSILTNSWEQKASNQETWVIDDLVAVECLIGLILSKYNVLDSINDS